MERFPILSDIFAAVREILPDLPLGGDKAPLVALAEIVSEMRAAGFESIAAEEVSVSAESPTLDDAWSFMHRGSPPLALIRKNIGEAAWHNVERGIVESLRCKYGSGAQKMTMVANLGVGRKPR
jgi:hypothetical protein